MTDAPNCSSGKIAYPDRLAAEIALNANRARDGLYPFKLSRFNPVRDRARRAKRKRNQSVRDFYLCLECGQWHLTKKLTRDPGQ